MKNDIQTQMGLCLIPPAFIDRAWKDGAHHLGEACERASDEVTADQLKMLLARGERELLCLMVGNEPKGWAAVQVQQLPNIRVLYVYSLYAPHHSLDVYSLLNQKAIEAGCSVIRGAVDEVNERLWQRVKAQKVYSIYQIEVSTMENSK